VRSERGESSDKEVLDDSILNEEDRDVEGEAVKELAAWNLSLNSRQP